MLFRTAAIALQRRSFASVSEGLPFSVPKHGKFYQEKFSLKNQFNADTFAQSYLRRVLPNDVYESIYPDLENFGERVATDIYHLGRECELNPPKLIAQDAWGEIVSDVKTCS